MKGFLTAVALGLLLVVLPIGCVGCWVVKRTAAVVDKELSPGALLKKYESFKDRVAALEAKRASIAVAEHRVKSLEKQYDGVLRKEWHRHDAEQHGLWLTEVAGMKASYNALAATYNADMAKANYQFCNVGDLPKGADKPLPREFAAYITE